MHSTCSNATTVAIADCSDTPTAPNFNVAPPAYDTVIVNGNAAANIAIVGNPCTTATTTSPSPNATTAPPMPTTRGDAMKMLAASMSTELQTLDKDAQLQYLKFHYIQQYGRTYDISIDRAQQMHLRDKQIRLQTEALSLYTSLAKDHEEVIRTSERQKRRLVARMSALRKHHDDMHPHASKISQWIQEGRVERIILRAENAASQAPTAITHTTATRSIRSDRMMVQRLSSQFVNGRRVAQRVNFEQEVTNDLKMRLTQAERVIEVLSHRYEELLATRPSPPPYEATQLAD